MPSERECSRQLKRLQAALGLGNWQISGIWVKAPLLEDARQAGIQFSCKDLNAILSCAIDRPDREVFESIAHELGHLLLAPLEEIARKAIGLADAQARQVLEALMDETDEQVAVQLSRTVGRLLLEPSQQTKP